MYCPKCGTENPDDAQVCRGCGAELTPSPPPPIAQDLIPRRSGLAIAAFVLGILSLLTLGLTAIPAIILGIVGLVTIQKSGGKLTGIGFAIGGIIVPVILVPVLLLVAILMPALSRAREQGKRAVCLSNVRQLTLAWCMYADDNDDRIVNGAAGLERADEPPWTGRDWASDYDTGGLLPEYEQKQAFTDGALWPYCKAVQVYRCPSGLPGHMRTYSIVDSMNGIPGKGTDEIQGVYIKKGSQIPRHAYRLVFIDVGEVMPETYSVYYDQPKWWDQPPVRHRDGTSVSFADGHADYWRWKGTETIERGRAATGVHNPDPAGHWSPYTSEGIEDLKKTQKGCWGRLGY